MADTHVNADEAHHATPTETRARQVIATAFGDPRDVLEIVTVTLPEPGSGQVVVAVDAAGVNPIDRKSVVGMMGTDESALPLHPGNELAGVVKAVGPDVTEYTVGDAVIGYPVPGAYADHVIVDTGSLHRRPDTLDAGHAAGLLLVGVTAADTIATARVTAGDVVLVHGGAGSVGAIAVQLALRAGATVIATAAPANHDHLRSLGAVPVTYGDGLSDRVRAAASGPVTVAIDTVGTDEAIDVSVELVTDRSRIVSIAAFGRADSGIVLVSGADAQSRRHRADAIDPLVAAAADGSLVTEVAATYPLTQAGTALADLGTAHPRGKFLLIP